MEASHDIPPCSASKHALKKTRIMEEKKPFWQNNKSEIMQNGILESAVGFSVLSSKIPHDITLALPFRKVLQPINNLQ